MNKYPKIQTVWKRDPDTEFRTLLEGQFSLPEFEYLEHNEWVFTEKVDGTNIRVALEGEVLLFGGKTDRSEIPKPLLERLNEQFNPEALLELFPDGVCLYGEGFGAKIQKGGGNYSPGQDFVLFDVYVGGLWLQRKDVKDISEKLGIEVVPIAGIGTLNKMVDLACDGFDSWWGDFPAEGIVARPTVELQTRRGERIITKIKTKDFRDSERSE